MLNFVFRRSLFCLALVPVVGGSGCSEEAPAAPAATLTDTCRPTGQFSVSGTRGENTRIIALVTPDGGDATEVEVAALDVSTDFNGTLVLSEDGVYSVSLVAENGSKVRSAATASVQFTVDSVLPEAPVGTLPTDAIAGANVVAELTTAVDAVSLVCTADPIGPLNDVPGTIGAAGTFTASFPINEGDNSFSCTALDTCGNRSSPTLLNISGTQDVVAAPVVLVPPANLRLAQGATTALVTASGTTEANTIVELTVDNGAATALTAGVDPLAWALSVELAAGTHALSLVAIRNETRSLPTVANVTVEPVLGAPTSTCASSPTKATSVSLSGTRTTNTSVQIIVNDEAPSALAAAAASTSWSANFDISGRADGALSYSLQSVDTLGAGDVSAACDLVIDRSAPAAPALDPVVGVIALGLTEGPVEFTGTAEIGALVFASLDGGASTQRTTVDPSGQFIFSLTVRVAGSPHSLAVKVVDAAGNESGVTTAAVTVRNALVRPTLTSPGNAAFPVLTRAAQVALVGTRPPTAGVLARFDDNSADRILVPNLTSGTSFNVNIPLAANASISFCLYSFDANGESDARCLTSGASMVMTNDSIAPADPVVTIPASTQLDTVSATVTKDAISSVAVSVNGGAFATRVLATNALTSVSVSNIALVLGANNICFKSADVAGNESAVVCSVVTRAAPGLTLVEPAEQNLINGNFVFVDAALLDATATSFTICVTTGAAAPVCQTLPVGGDLQQDVDIGAPPAAATLVNIEVCGTDGLVTACANRNIVRWGAPEQLSTSVSTQAKATPAIAVDQLGHTHLVWQDVSNVCSTGHLDVVTGVSRNASDRLLISVSRPGELGLAANNGFNLLGTTSFNGLYTVRSVTNGVVETNQTVSAGAPEAAGNLVTTSVKSGCAGPDIFYARLDDNGWSDTINLSDVGGDAASSAPALITDENGDVHVVWQENGNLNPLDGSASPPDAPADGVNTDLVHRVIDGVTGAISLPLVISTQDDASSLTFVDDKAPALAASSAGLVAAWETVGAANARQVLVSRFNGLTWSTPVVAFARTTTTATLPAVGIGPSGVAYVSWVENSGRVIQGGAVGTAGDRDIVLCPLNPADTVCLDGAAILVSNGADLGNSSEPAIAVDAVSGGGESVHVVWSDDEGRGSAAKHVLHKRLLLRRAAGQVIGPITSVTDSGNGQNPTIAVTPDSTEILVAWTDNSPTSGSGHSEFTLMSSVGLDRDANIDLVAEACTFSLPALMFSSAGVLTTADSGPALAVNTQRGAFIAFVHQPSNGSADSEIFAYGLQY